MLYENDVVEAVCKKLEEEGYCIIQRLTTDQRGYDIIAVKETPDKRSKLIIEAKGATSSKENTERFILSPPERLDR